MIPKAVKEWLSEFKALPDSEIHTYASTICQNDDLIRSLYELFDSKQDVEVLDTICHQLFEFYRSKEAELQRFCLNFFPILIWLYLSALSRNEKKNCGGIEAFLLGVYNLEIVYGNGEAKVKAFSIPSLAQPSVYHEPVKLSSLSLTESALSRYNQTEAETWTSSPCPQYEAVNGVNRQGILTYLLQCYNQDVANLSSRSHHSLCNAFSRIAYTGFTGLISDICDKVTNADDAPNSRKNGLVFTSDPRVAVSPSLLIEMLSGAYYAMFNGVSVLGIDAVQHIHHRASYELYADVLLVSNAICNSLRNNPSGQPHDGPIGVSVALSSTTTTFSKSAITNASFRTKKLPEDITPLPKAEDDASKLLPVIEESADSPSRSSSKTVGKDKGTKQGKKLEKIRLQKKDSDISLKAIDLNMKSSVNGERADGTVTVSVVKGQTSYTVDNVELQNIQRKSGADDQKSLASDTDSGSIASGHDRTNSQPGSIASGHDRTNSQSGSIASGHDRTNSQSGNDIRYAGSKNSSVLSTDL